MTTFATSGTIKDITINTSGVYAFTAAGAQGGSATGGRAGGLGAAVSGDIFLQGGTVLELVIGGAGGNGSGVGGGGGGGGGTFIIESDNDDMILAVAGGGGGAGFVGAGSGGRTGPTGGAGSSTQGGAGGVNGAPGHGGRGGGAGGGGFTGGNATRTGGTGGSGSTAATTFAGGQSAVGAGNGGLGGGGGSNFLAGGGGGGYGGGGGGALGRVGGSDGGGGGGSYLSPGVTSGAETAATHSGGGEVTITYEAPCFLPGTQIMTPDGERAVETLAPGDHVLTHSGAARPILWIGTGKTRAIRGHRNAATPIIVCKGAFAPNVPNRDLRVTKGHSFHLDNVLIPAEFLVNHRSVLWDDRAQDVTVFHIELETHDVILANGAAAESYRDDGNRWLFSNRSPGWERPAPPPCAPVLTGGAVVDAVWRRILDRAGVRPGLPLTDDPDLHIMADGARLDPVEQSVAFVRFVLPAGAHDIRLVSRAAVPQELGIARDARALGVAVQGIAVWKGRHVRAFSAEEAMFSQGFYPFEPATNGRWTNGQACLPPAILEGFEGAVELVISRSGSTRYVEGV